MHAKRCMTQFLTRTVILLPPPTQVAEVLEQDAKWAWLQARLASFIDQGDVLIFAATKARVDELTAQLQAAGVKWAFLAASSLPVVRGIACHACSKPCTSHCRQCVRRPHCKHVHCGAGMVAVG
jgi:hypothetical protein